MFGSRICWTLGHSDIFANFSNLDSNLYFGYFLRERTFSTKNTSSFLTLRAFFLSINTQYDQFGGQVQIIQFVHLRLFFFRAIFFKNMYIKGIEKDLESFWLVYSVCPPPSPRECAAGGSSGSLWCGRRRPTAPCSRSTN